MNAGIWKIVVLLAPLTTAVCGGATTPAAERPNIIFILADDLGLPGVGCCGGKFKTPHLDALASGGMRFERCYSAPLCAPSRALCMFGRYAFRTGVLNNGCGAAAKPDAEVCLAKVMKQAGYATAVAGKWRQLTYLHSPEDAQAWGWDEFLIWAADSGGKGSRYWDPALNHNGQTVPDVKDKFAPDLLHDFVVDFIGRHRHEPFFIYYPTTLIHGKLMRTPDSTSSADLYADNVVYLDKLVGQLMSELERLKLREKTLVVFTGDNGSARGGSRDLDADEVEGAKGALLEGGSRVPLIAQWKSVTPAGKVLKDLVDFSDFFATFAELGGAKLPAGVILDSHSFAPQLRGQPGQPREWAYVQLSSKWYVRSDQWKLNERGQLFNMRHAPFKEELTPLEGQSTEAAAARQQLQGVLDKLNPGAGQTPERGAKAGEKQKKRKSGRDRKGKKQKSAAET